MRAIAVAVLATAAVACLPGAAHATCGSYVTIADFGHHGLITTGHDSHPLPISPLPCHGPGCSQSPAEPVSPLSVPATFPPESKQSSGPDAVDAEHGLQSGWLHVLAGSDRPTRLPSSIFHPPRGI